jgi:hypothetical protein
VNSAATESFFSALKLELIFVISKVYHTRLFNMVFFNLDARSRRINNEKSAKFCGNAKIDINQLHFEWDEDPNKNKISHIQNIFKNVGCDRINSKHFIPGNISASLLAASLEYSNLSRHDLLKPEPPELRLPPQKHVQCMKGGHRILALRKYNPHAT